MTYVNNFGIRDCSQPSDCSCFLQQYGQQLNNLREQIYQFHEKIKGFDIGDMATLSSGQLFGLYSELDSLGHMDVNDKLCQQILHDPIVHSLLPDIYSRYRYFFSLHEMRLAEEILDCKEPWTFLESFSLYSRYELMIRDYVHNCPEISSLAFLGCGPFPISLLLLGRLYGIHCVGIDCDPAAAAVATRCVKHLGLENEIKIIQGDESSLSEFDWDSVLIAGLAWPKQRIFKNLYSMLKGREQKGREKPSTICYRDYSGMRQLFYWPVKEEHLTGFRKVKSVLAEGKVNNTMVFLECE